MGEKLFYQKYVNVISQFPFHEVHSIVHDHLTPPLVFENAKELSITADKHANIPSA